MGGWEEGTGGWQAGWKKALSEMMKVQTRAVEGKGGERLILYLFRKEYTMEWTVDSLTAFLASRL